MTIFADVAEGKLTQRMSIKITPIQLRHRSWHKMHAVYFQNTFWTLDLFFLPWQCNTVDKKLDLLFLPWLCNCLGGCLVLRRCLFFFFFYFYIFGGRGVDFVGEKSIIFSPTCNLFILNYQFGFNIYLLFWLVITIYCNYRIWYNFGKGSLLNLTFSSM